MIMYSMGNKHSSFQPTILRRSWYTSPGQQRRNFIKILDMLDFYCFDIDQQLILTFNNAEP